MKHALIAAVSLAAVTAIGRFFAVAPTTVGFVYLIAVLLLSVSGGLLIGTLSSVVAALCYNFFFFPPLYTLNIERPENWFSLAAFFIAAVIGSRLVAAAHLQAVRESEELKTSLLRAISHDLTTPITAMSIRTESIRRRAGADNDLIEDVTAIAEETSRLRRRIGNLLSMARLEAGKTKPHREPTPPADLFRAARENLPMVPMSVHVDDDCPDANVDPSLTLEILVNLIENAHRVSPQGATIELAAMKHPSDDAMLRIEVRDRGPGLPPGVMDGDVAQRGLGLEIARSLAAANGGSIAHVAREGGGTIACIDLPAARLERA
jgi:two-component system sensor histidine kinase KdpD